jgi:hypothetical protein
MRNGAYKISKFILPNCANKFAFHLPCFFIYLTSQQKDDLLRTSKPVPKSAPRLAMPPSPLTQHATQEEMFWNTPAASARTLRFTDKLMDEEVDINDISVISFTSPVPRPRSVLSSLGLPANDDSLVIGGRDTRPDESVILDPADEDELVKEGDELEMDDEEQTIVLTKLPQLLSPKPTPAERNTPPETPQPELQTPAVVPPGSTRKPKVSMNSEIERIVVSILSVSSRKTSNRSGCWQTKIWSTVGEIIMPGHPFDSTGSVSGRNKPPGAKETLYVVDFGFSSFFTDTPSAHLETLSSQRPSLASPTTSSLSSLAPSVIPGQPTSQQIATCQLLLTLLVQPGFSMQLNKLKEALAERGGGTSGTRTLYACVAKKLIKIERGGGEQVIKFDA